MEATAKRAAADCSRHMRLQLGKRERLANIGQACIWERMRQILVWINVLIEWLKASSELGINKWQARKFAHVIQITEENIIMQNTIVLFEMLLADKLVILVISL